ncbi:MAG: tRNA threonylcarbamoyladenosine dehydratase [Candidatus Wallbacteria bacterium]|nr:tRNA threonylcarbamoyladenosine dehydratase [Candidatus Wallbacteria bacterium]
MDTSLIFHRLELLIGKNQLERIKTKKVIIFGTGGVGSWCAESLVRSGIRQLALVDSDFICITNLNRQLQTNVHNIGKSKVQELRNRLLTINPVAQIAALKEIYEERTSSLFHLEQYDYVIDAIDSLKNKIHLLATCREKGIPVFSSMGSACKINPSKIRVGKLSETTICPLAKRVRRGLRESGLPEDIICVYSVEPASRPLENSTCGSENCVCPDIDEHNWCEQKARINGTVAHIPAIFGFTLSGLVIMDIVGNVNADK